MTTVGEPIEPDVWRWYHQVVGKGEAAITDTWWQTENGGFLGSTLPFLQPMKPGSCGPGVLGIYPVIYDEDGNEVPKGSGKAGNMCIGNPWPGSFLTIWGQPERFVETYYAKYNKDKDSKDWRDWPYFSNDGAMQAADGYFRILGRVDDVINVAGHRLGTKELESAAIEVDEVAEAAAVPVIDELRGKAVEMYVSVKARDRSRGAGRTEGLAGDREGHRQDRSAEERVGRARRAQDPLGQDHAPRDRRDLELHRRRRHHHARKP
jgi:acetyl-CoA synthetase